MPSPEPDSCDILVVDDDPYIRATVEPFEIDELQAAVERLCPGQ